MFQLFSQSCNVIELLTYWKNIAGTRSPTQYLTGEKQLDVYWQTLCAEQMPEGFSTAKKDFCYKYYTPLQISRPFVRLVVRFFPRTTEKDTWYNRVFYFLFRVVWRVLGLTPSKIQRNGFPPQSVLSNYRRIVPTRNGYVRLASRTRNPGTGSQCPRMRKCR